MVQIIAAICIGASFGAVFRWFLGVKLNHFFVDIPLGTLSANLIGGYIAGICLVYFAQNESIAAEYRLLIVTGFLGGLTTFSTFSVEMVSLLQQAKYQMFAVGVVTHTAGSILATLLGVATYGLIAKIVS